jgi:hypothetical protein
MAGRRWLPWITAVVLLGGCGSAADGPFQDGPVGDDVGRLHQQARDALVRYDKAVHDAGGGQRFVPVGELTGQLGDWEPTNENNKAALLAGRIQVATALPGPPRATGQVVWENGTTLAVPLVSAEQALSQLRAAGAGDCPDCVPLEVTGARLTTKRIQTTRGPATVPAWEYTLKGTTVRVTRPAVASSAIVTVTPPSWDPYHSGGLAIESATTATSSRQLTVSFTGSPGPASQPCGIDYTAEAVESDNAVVVIVIAHPHVDGEACTSIGAPRSATAELTRPLGERAVLEVQQGMPVPLTVTE